MKTVIGPIRFFLLLILFLSFTFATIYAQSELNTTDSLLLSGKRHFKTGDYKAAKVDFEEIRTIRERLLDSSDKKLIESYFYLGLANVKLVFYEDALKLFEQALALAELNLDKRDELLGQLYLELVNIHELMYAPQKAIPMAQKAIALFDEIHGSPYIETGTLNMIIGVCFTDTGQFEDAENFLLKALKIFQKTASPKSFEMIRVYSNLGRAYRKMNDFDKALDYCQKALETNQLSHDDNHPSMAEFYYNLGKVYSWRGDHEDALQYMQKTLELDRKNLGEDHPSTGGSYGELGGVYADLKQYDKSLPLYFKSLEIMEKRLSMTHPAVVAGYNNIAMVYEETERYDQALDFYRLSIEKYKENPNTQFLMSDTYRNMAKTFYYQEQIDSAFYYLGLGIESIALNFKHQLGKDDQYPNMEEIQANVFYIKFLRLKSKFFEEKHAQNNSLSELQHALKSLEIAIQVVEKVRRSYESDGSRSTLNRNVSDLFEEAIRLSFDLYEQTENIEYLLKAFHFSEKSKASILWQHINDDFALANAGIPDEQLTHIAQIGQQIDELEESLFNADDANEAKPQEAYFNLKLEYEQAINDLEQFNPNYFQLKYASPKIELNNLIQKIPDDQSLLVEYFHDEEHLYIFIISKDGLKGSRHAYSKKLENSIQALREFDVHQYLNNQGENNSSFIAHLNYLYDALIRPIQTDLKNNKQLVIVPHGVLNYLPFGMLAPTSDLADYRTVPYLLKTTTIQYVNSLAIWEKETTEKRHFQEDFLGFAPFSGQHQTNLKALPQIALRSDLTELRHSGIELAKAEEYFPGQTFFHQSATESAFLKNVEKSRIVHLATHAIANDEDPTRSGLLFAPQTDSLEDGYLNVYEIYNMTIPAELAIMSACNTGFGQLAEGEGVISLGRAFSYAGCKSVLMSLWKANDSSTAHLMGYFYENLAAGQAKDLALQNAKLNYLANSDPLMAHPYFWAGMIAVGDMVPIQSSAQSFWIYLVLGLVFLLFSIAWIYRKKQRI